MKTLDAVFSTFIFFTIKSVLVRQFSTDLSDSKFLYEGET